MVKDERTRERILCDLKQSLRISTFLNITRLLIILIWCFAFIFLDIGHGDVFYESINFFLVAVIIVETMSVCGRNIKVKSLLKKFYISKTDEERNKWFNNIYIQTIFATSLGIKIKDFEDADT